MDKKYIDFFQNRLLKMGFVIMATSEDRAMEASPCMSCCFMHECGGQKELVMLKNCRTFLRYNQSIDDRADIADPPHYEAAIDFINAATEENIKVMYAMAALHK